MHMKAPGFARKWIGVALLALAASAFAADDTLKGKVLEVQQAGQFTYMRLKTAKEDIWAATSAANVQNGATVTLKDPTVMKNFRSNKLNKDFGTVVFGTLVEGGSGWTAENVPSVHGSSAASKPVDLSKIKVPKASGDNAFTVSEINARSASLKDKPVTVSGMVVRYNGGIMDRNWIHLRDGSGSESDQSNDILVTTQDGVKVGDVVTVSGTVRLDQDFGSGYRYKVVVEGAKVRQ